MTETAHPAERDDAHWPGKIFRSRRERVVTCVMFVALTAVALSGRPLVELILR